MIVTLAIDPGVDTGWALYGDRLLACGLGEPRVLCSERGTPLMNRVVIERPQVYAARQSKGDPNDLITLAIRVGRYTERFESRNIPVEHVLPRTWKGTVDKAILCRRIEASLTTEEVALIPQLAASKRHNVLDAIGLAKWSRNRSRAATFDG